MDGRTLKRRMDTTVQCKRRRIIQTQHKHSMLSSVDVLLEILSRLPTSSLLRLRFVSQLWHSLIIHPSLGELHLDRGFKSPTLPSIILRSSDRLYLIEKIPKKKIHKRRVITEESEYSISPPCNGIICLYNNSEVKLVNPITKENLLLQEPLNPTICISSVCLLGFLPTTHEYKVIRFYNLRTVQKTEQGLVPTVNEQTGCQVLTVGASAWRVITHNFVPLFRQIVSYAIKSMATYDGSAYFLAYTSGNRDPILVSFDLESEMLARINLPRNEITRIGNMTISKMKSCLCVSVSYRGRLEIWMLKSRKKRAHWSQKYHLHIPLNYPKPVFIHGGQLLLWLGENFYYWDLEKVEESFRMRHRRKMTQTGCCYYSGGNISQAYLHEGSLVSLSNLVKKV